MIYALDTNIISYMLRGDKEINRRWRREESIGNTSVIPLIVYYEVKRGLQIVEAKTKLEAFLHLCGDLTVEDLTTTDIDTAIRIYAERRKQGNLIEDADLLIAAQCITNDYTLVTNNTRHFECIDGLKYINWVK